MVRGHFTSPRSAQKLIYLALREVSDRWRHPGSYWPAAKREFAIHFEGRFQAASPITWPQSPSDWGFEVSRMLQATVNSRAIFWNSRWAAPCRHRQVSKLVDDEQLRLDQTWKIHVPWLGHDGPAPGLVTSTSTPTKRTQQPLIERQPGRDRWPDGSCRPRAVASPARSGTVSHPAGGAAVTGADPD